MIKKTNYFVAHALRQLNPKEQTDFIRRGGFDAMAEGGKHGTQSAMWAVATLLIVVLAFTILYFSGVLSNKTRTKGFFEDPPNAISK
jgi:hypothetical protein